MTQPLVIRFLGGFLCLLFFSQPVSAADESEGLDQPANTWVKRSPLATTPPSPRLGYEGACVWDSRHKLMIRYGGHNQGGGGEQGSEIWTFDPLTARWELKQPNISPPGICCDAQNVFDPIAGRYIRFPSFSGSHGWQWFREIYLNDSTVWNYDLDTNTWRNRRPVPTPRIHPLRCASWDTHHQVVVVFGGEGSTEGTLVYDPHTNVWTRKNPRLQPDFRSGGNLAYDEKNRVHVLFGAQFINDPYTWVYDLAKNEWDRRQPDVTPHTDKNDAVLTYDLFAQRVLAIIKISEGKEEQQTHRLESWSYDAAANKWTKLNPPQEPDSTSNRARQLLFAPELNVAILENRTHGTKPGSTNEQQIWTYRAASRPENAQPATAVSANTLREQPRIVEDVVVSVVSPQRVELSWSAPQDEKVTGYLVERAPVEVFTEDQLPRLKSQTPPLEVPSVGAIRRIGAFTRLRPEPIAARAFTDETVDLTKINPLEGEPLYERQFGKDQYDESGKSYRFAVFAYRVLAVNAKGITSGPSAAYLTIPSPPQFVFSREQETACQLRWNANPERGLAGYRIYRMDGRYAKDPIRRLTNEPISATEFVDLEAGKPARRYHIVAVDALGQEGFPSSPVWYNREWKSFYLPFVEDWHQ